MKKAGTILSAMVIALSLTACGGESKESSGSDVDGLVSEYGFQWTDTTAPILNDKGAAEISFNIYSSKNASALDYNDMKIMQDLYDSTNVNVTWENVSESVYEQQKNLILGNADNRPDAIYHAGMGLVKLLSMPSGMCCFRLVTILNTCLISLKYWKNVRISRTS